MVLHLLSFAFLCKWLLHNSVYKAHKKYDFKIVIMSQQGEKRKRGVYNTKTIQKKAAACHGLEGGMALLHVAKKYNVSKSTVVSWCKQKDNILTDANRVRKDRYRHRKSPATEVEPSLLMWIKQMNSLPNLPPLSWRVTQAKANE